VHAPAASAPPAARELHALAGRDADAARRAVAEALDGHPLDPELHYLDGVLLVARGRFDDAEQALRRALYLDRSSSLAHFMLGVIRRRRGDRAQAARSFETCAALAAALPPAAEIPLGDGETAGSLAAAARAQLALLDAGAR
jgi:chemotaxis protein methyltransferase CheR